MIASPSCPCVPIFPVLGPLYLLLRVRSSPSHSSNTTRSVHEWLERSVWLDMMYPLDLEEKNPHQSTDHCDTALKPALLFFVTHNIVVRRGRYNERTMNSPVASSLPDHRQM